MKVFSVFLAVAILWALLGRLVASPWDFVSSSSASKEYIVTSISNCICSSEVILAHRRFDEFRRTEYLLCPCALELGMATFRCVEVLKGDESIGDYKVIFLYDTARVAGVLPRPHYWMSESGGSGYSIRENGATRILHGKEVWPYFPPYDPYSFAMCHEYVELRFVMPVKSPIMNRVRFGEDYYIGNERHVIPASKNLSGNELSEMLGVGMVYSNRVYQAIEGCSFQVDYPVPVLEWKNGVMTKNEEESLVDSYRKEADASIMHLSPDEASEIVYLAYLADKRYTVADYAAACKRCPKFLKHVKAFKTEIGRRLKAAMEAGGMLPKK